MNFKSEMNFMTCREYVWEKERERERERGRKERRERERERSEILWKKSQYFFLLQLILLVFSSAFYLTMIAWGCFLVVNFTYISKRQIRAALDWNIFDVYCQKCGQHGWSFFGAQFFGAKNRQLVSAAQ